MEKECNHPTCGDHCRRKKNKSNFYHRPTKKATTDAVVNKAEIDLHKLMAKKELAAGGI